MSIPFADLPALQREIETELWPRLREVFDAAAFIGGRAVHDFEREYAEYVGVGQCVGVGNGTDAIELAVRALGIGVGDEVIMPGNTFIATAEAVLRAGAVPVFVDVDPVRLLIDPSAVEAALTPRTRAVVAVHLYGRLAPVKELAEIAAKAGIIVIEDAAQSQGARADGKVSGSFGTIAATSFYPGKNLGAAGDGGAVTTDDPELARSVRLLSAHGSERRYVHERLGFNSRLDAVQAVVLSTKLTRLDRWNARRRQAAASYTAQLQGIDGIVPPSSDGGEAHVWHLYVVQVDERDEVARRLAAVGVDTGIHYPHPVHLSPALGEHAMRTGSLPVVEAAAPRLLSLPMFPTITGSQLDEVVDEVRRAVAAGASREEAAA